MLATQPRGERGDAYVALKSVMRAHAKEEGWERSSAVNETETLWKDEENKRRRKKGRGGESDKRNVESKKQKGRKRNKSAACGSQEKARPRGWGKGAIS